MKLLFLQISLLPIFLFSIAFGSKIRPVEAIVDEALSKVVSIAPYGLKLALESPDPPLVVDVRTRSEYDAGHLPGAIWVPRGMLEYKITGHAERADRSILVYCRTGGRGALSAVALQEMGYRKVTNLDGGFKNWVESGLRIFNAHGEVEVIHYGKSENQG